MADFPEIDTIVLTVLQVVALLFPVVFLSLNLVRQDAGDSMEPKHWEALRFPVFSMIMSLTITGILATLAIFDASWKPAVAYLSVSFLVTFFGMFGYFFYKANTFKLR